MTYYIVTRVWRVEAESAEEARASRTPDRASVHVRRETYVPLAQHARPPMSEPDPLPRARTGPERQVRDRQCRRKVTPHPGHVWRHQRGRGESSTDYHCWGVPEPSPTA